MIQINYRLFLLGLLFLVGMILTACSEDVAEEEPDNEDPQEEDAVEDGDKGEPQPGGTITGAMYSAPSGMFNPIFYEEAYEANILDFTHESLFIQNENLEFEPNIAEEGWELNDDQTELTIHLKEDVTWHDGENFTAHDVVFTYQSIADPDYVKAGGVRSNYVTPLLGYEEYVEGETDEFEGVVAEDDYTVTFNFNEPNVHPNILQAFLLFQNIFLKIFLSLICLKPKNRVSLVLL